MNKFNLFNPMDKFKMNGATSTVPAIKPLYKFTSWTPSTNIDNTRSIVNEGTEDNLNLFSGAGKKFNGTNQELDGFTIPPTATHMIYIKDSAKVYTTTLIDFGTATAIPSGIYKDVYYFNRALTTAEQDNFTLQPEQFHVDALSDATCLINMPMCDTDTNVRDMISYNEGVEITSEFNSGHWINQSGNFSVIDNKVICNAVDNIKSFYEKDIVTANQIYLIELVIDSISTGDIAILVGSSRTELIPDSGSYLFAIKASLSTHVNIVNYSSDAVISKLNVLPLSGIYSLTNHAVDTNVDRLQYGTQNLKLPMDDLGLRDGTITPYIVGDGESTAKIPSNIRTTNIELVVNPTSLDGDVLSGGVTLSAGGLTLDTDNTITFENQTITDEVVLLDGFKGTLKSYKETEV